MFEHLNKMLQEWQTADVGLEVIVFLNKLVNVPSITCPIKTVVRPGIRKVYEEIFGAASRILPLAANVFILSKCDSNTS